eukprot:68923_1
MAFVTGGSGYVGRNLIRYLKKKNWGIRALARSEKSANVVSDLGAEPINGDLSSVEAMTNAMKSCDVCFHCAAPVEFWGNLDKYLRITRDGTGNVIKACKDSGIPKLIYLSSIVVLMSQAFSMNNLDETMDYRDDLYGTYQICKKEAEILALAANEDDKLSVVILRPPMIWGNDDTSLLPKVLETAHRHIYQWINQGKHYLSMCHVFNVVHGLYLLFEKGKPGEIYFVNDGKRYSVKEFYTDLFTVTGAPQPFVSIPYKCMFCCGQFMDCLFCCGQACECCECCVPPFHSIQVLGMGLPFNCNDDKIRNELGFEDQISVKDGMLQLADRFNIERESIESKLICQ